MTDTLYATWLSGAMRPSRNRIKISVHTRLCLRGCRRCGPLLTVHQRHTARGVARVVAWAAARGWACETSGGRSGTFETAQEVHSYLDGLLSKGAVGDLAAWPLECPA